MLDSYAAFARGDIDAAVASLHPDVVWTEHACLRRPGVGSVTAGPIGVSPPAPARGVAA